ncbi:MAG TPA: cellulase N-terminal Ig-like domain-containing protein, partial [Cytophagales bacterium]|nr:cellulase N-terminal Ig-like domain-containing protein [Cytophagales bacterium]
MKNTLLFQTLIWIQLCTCWSQTISPFIVVDQFGYLPNSNKVAVVRDPQVGYDAAQNFTPGTTLDLKDATTNQTVFSAAPRVWNAGNTDAVSGDKAWWFDFSAFRVPGSYYVLDPSQNARSATFLISDTVYQNVLKAAVRTFFYQRAGFAKTTPFAEAGWTDGASHLGPLQDKNCRLYSA